MTALIPISPVKRFWDKVWFQLNCWEWTAAKNVAGYGVFRPGGSANNVYAHRFSYELAKGVIPGDFTVDHLCRNKACVNPAHLEAVSLQENLSRRVYVPKTHCPQGHVLDGGNVSIDRGARRCKTCGRDRARIKRDTKLTREMDSLNPHGDKP